MKFIEGSFLDTTKYIKRTIKSTCFCFTLSYVDEDTRSFYEINRFKEQSCQELAPFKNQYVGYALIDLSEWADKPVNSKLEAFLFFLLDRQLYSSKNRVVFFSEKEAYSDLKRLIEKMFGKVEYIDLGVKKKHVNHSIGFILDNQTKEENENVRS